MKDFALGVVYAGLVAILFIPLLVANEYFFPFITGKNFWFRIIVEIVLAAWILLAIYDKQYRPKFSWFLPSMVAILVVMFFANILGENPLTSFWSNYERMDGYVTLVHFAAFFLVLGSVFSHKEVTFLGNKTTPWQIFSVAALVAAIAVSFSAFKQLSGAEETTMGWRINGTLGNAAYMAVYMLFNTFVALWAAMHARTPWFRTVCLLLAALFAFLLIQTATRGTILGLAAGTLLGSLYIAIANTAYPKIRKAALGAVLAVVILVGGLATFKNSDFVQNNLILQRSTAVSFSELSLRMDIWGIALKGASERPLLGWGQSNFNYVFNEYYQPDFAHRAELWYDRAHNVFMDWLVTGGILGLVAYLSLFVGALYYLVWMPLRGRETGFTVLEHGLLIGIGSAYFVHNLVVFDNIVSYIFFAILLAMIHSKVAKNIKKIDAYEAHPAVVAQVFAPIIVLITIAVVYFVNVPGMQAAKDIIISYQTQTVAGKQEAFDNAFSRGSFAIQELTEQMAQSALSMVQNPQLPQEEVNRFVANTETRLNELVAAKPGDARVHVFLVSFYRGINQIEKAREQALIARGLSPNKPHIVLEQALVEYQAGDLAAMQTFMKEAYEMDPKNRDAQIFYSASSLLNGVPEEEAMSVVEEVNWPGIVTNNFVLQAADGAGATNTMIRILESRIALATTTPQNYFSLSYVFYKAGRNDEAVEVLKRAETAIPSVKKNTQCFIGNIQSGQDPNLGCQ